MSASADKPKQTCGKCGTLFQLVGQFLDLCAACLLELGWEEEEPTASAERFDHYQVANHTDGTPVELGRGAMGITYRASDAILGNEVALKVIDARIATLPKLGNVFCEKPARRLGFATRILPQSFTTGHARVMVNAFTRWNWSRAKHWKPA
jgi:hypothetical protein